MGLMTRVMQKIEDEATAAASSSPIESVIIPPEEPGSAFVAEPAAPDTPRPTAEAPGSVSDPAAAWERSRVDPVVVVFHDRYSSICEQYRAVRARLLTLNPPGTSQIIAITSSVPQEGKSATALNLGLVMAEGGEHRILVMEADFRRSSLARLLGIPAEPGLADVLRGRVRLSAALQPTPLANLKVLPAGQVADQADADLLGGSGAAAVLEEIRGGFDYALVDMPSVTTVSDVCLLGPRCDGVILVVEMGRTPEPIVQQAVRTLQATSVKVLGCVLSRFDGRGAGYDDYDYGSQFNPTS